VYSRYERTLADAAIVGQHVVLQLRMRRFFCHHPGCPPAPSPSRSLA
jgi:hypothetical protein